MSTGASPENTISIAQVLELLHQRHRSLPLLEFFEADFKQRVEQSRSHVDGWLDHQLTERDAANLLGATVRILEELAMRFAHTTDDPVYADATTVAQSIHSIVAECYGFQSCTIQIMPPTRGLEKAGLAEVVPGEDGELYVKPTQLSREIASRVLG